MKTYWGFQVEKIALTLVALFLFASCQGSFTTQYEAFTAVDFSAKFYDTFDDVADPVTQMVDNYYSSHRELSKIRYVSSATNYTDACIPELAGKNTFGSRIAWAINKRMKPSKPRIGYVYSSFGLSNNEANYQPTGLLSHPLCRTSASTLNTTFEGKNIPTQSVINKVNKFVDTMNGYRSEAIAGNVNSQIKAQKLWTKLYMCLSYMESLTTADTAKSDTAAAKYLPSGVRRPAGVSFLESTLLNVGLYQFDPDSGGNVQSCIREWNELVPNCSVDKNTPANKMVQILGSSHQTFNAFCGVAKLTGMMGVQVNTSRIKNTFPTNVDSNGYIKAPKDRCVSFTMNVNTSYNHFAPFQNGSGFTLDNIMTCTLNGEI